MDFTIKSRYGQVVLNKPVFFFLAYRIPKVRHPSVVVHTFKRISLKPVGQSWSNFICSITGIGEMLHKFLGQIGSKFWFPWQQKPPLIYNGENSVSTFSRLFFIWSFLYLQVTRTCIKSWKIRISARLDHLLPSYTPLGIPIDFEWGKWWLHLFSVTMNSDFIKLTGNEDRHQISDRFEFWSYLTSHFGVICPSAVKKFMSPAFLSNLWLGFCQTCR